jgi:hypothetical protein
MIQRNTQTANPASINRLLPWNWGLGPAVILCITVLTFYYAYLRNHRELFVRFPLLQLAICPGQASGDGEARLQFPVLNEGLHSETILGVTAELYNFDPQDNALLASNFSVTRTDSILIPSREARIIALTIASQDIFNQTSLAPNQSTYRAIAVKFSWLQPDGSIQEQQFKPYFLEYSITNSRLCAYLETNSREFNGDKDLYRRTLIYGNDSYWTFFSELPRRILNST